MWKYSGIFLILTGIIHTIYAGFIGSEIFSVIIKDGLINSIQTDPERSFMFWFFITGLIIIVLGQICHQYIRATQHPLPRSFGWTLLILTVIGLVVVPVSDFWLLLPQIAVIFWCTSRTYMKNLLFKNNLFY